MGRKTLPMRMSEPTIQIVNMLAATIQLKTGRNVSADTALLQFFEQHYDDLPEEAQTIIDELREKREGGE